MRGILKNGGSIFVFQIYLPKGGAKINPSSWILHGGGGGGGTWWLCITLKALTM
jgi:hypothetical protein